MKDQPRPLRVPRDIDQYLHQIKIGKIALGDLKPGDRCRVQDAMLVRSMSRVVDDPNDRDSFLSNLPGRPLESPDDQDEQERASKIESLLAVLDDRSRLVVRLHLGLDGESPHSFDSIARNHLHVRGSRVHQIYHQAIRIMRNHARDAQLECA